MPPGRCGIAFYKRNFEHEGAVIYPLLGSLESTRVFAILAATDTSPKLDLSIEGMQSQHFSVGVFIFMLFTIFVFSAIVYSVVFGKYAPKTMRLGEKILFGAIILGIIAAIVFGALQMLSGYLF
jgi:cytochrome b561